MKIALLQIASPGDEPVADRRRRVARMLESAQGADLVVLPELWAVGYFAFDRYAAAAETLDGESIRDAASFARRHQCHVHLGSFVEDVDQGRYRNTAVLVRPDGSIALRYSKIHVFGYQSLEAELLDPGESIDVRRSPFGMVSTTTCYDLRFPELWRRLVDIGAETVIVPAAWPAARLEHWRALTTARAIEQQVVVIACNAVGRQAGTDLAGHSRVVSPWGEVLVEAGTEEGITWCEVDPGEVSQVRQEFPVLRDRLADYSALHVPEGDHDGILD